MSAPCIAAPTNRCLRPSCKWKSGAFHQRLDWAIAQNSTSGHREFYHDMLQSWCIVASPNHLAKFDNRVAGIQA